MGLLNWPNVFSLERQCVSGFVCVRIESVNDWRLAWKSGKDWRQDNEDNIKLCEQKSL